MRLRELSGKTIGARRLVLGLVMRHTAKPILEVTAADLDSWQHSLGILAANTRKVYISHVYCFYDWATKTRRIETNPADVLIRPRTRRGLPRPIGEKALEVAVTEAPTMYRIWFELAGYEGLRAGEIAAVERADILEDASPPGLIVHGKGGKTRAVPLSPRPLASLMAYPLPVRGPVFRMQCGRPVTAHYVSMMANRYLHRIGIPESLHQMRHRFGTRLLQVNGGNIRQVQEQMGHASIETTAIYTALDLWAAAPFLDAIDHPLTGPLLRPVQETGT
jgi:integrase/recombinase XerC